MKQVTIRKSSTDSVNSIDKTNYVDFELTNTSKLLLSPNIIDTVDAYEVFTNERDACEYYRLILTINPYCTNVLFNPMTEIIKNEGSPDVEVIYDGSTAKNTNGCYGISRPTRQEMIMNTEYSREAIGYEYHPGFDFFTNHIMRNLTFKMVNKIGTVSNIKDSFLGSTPTVKEVFNTLGDFMRYSDGDVVKYKKRTSITSQSTDLNTELNKHLYLYDDLLSMSDSINNNLTEENGWFGFINNSSVSSKEMTTDTSVTTGERIWEDLDISRSINNKENCEFVDMYPDRTLFSFNPKINTYRKRLEYNWDIMLTYPYRNNYDYDIVYGSGVNALKLFYLTKTRTVSGGDAIVFRSFAKHGISRGNTIRLYAIKNGTVTELSNTIKVTGVGNMSSANDDNQEYYFYTTDMNIINELFGYTLSMDTDTQGEWVDTDGNIVSDNNISNALREYEFRFARIVSGLPSKYYIRMFKKLPNLKRRKKNLTEEIASDNDLYEEYLVNNAMDDDGVNMLEFSKEQYRLGFSKTIYNDAATQVTFTDTIDLSYIRDNLGRPLTEIFVTMIKANRGHEEWYGVSDEGTISTPSPDDSNVEFSHCFGKVSSGFEFSNTYSDRYNLNNILQDKRDIGDVTTLNELGDSIPGIEAFAYEKRITKYGTYDIDGNKTVNEYIGDLVEFNPNEVIEHVLESVNHRFNTMQRELPSTNKAYNTFVYQEIESDDYDVDVFTVSEYYGTGENSNMEVYQRPEGYFYKPHYSIMVKELGNINQDSHYDIKVTSAKPVQLDGIYISVTSSLSHKLSVGDIVYICVDDVDRDNYEGNFENDKWYKFAVSYVESNHVFMMSPYNMTWAEFTTKVNTDIGVSYNWINLCMAIYSTNTSNRVYVRRQNTDIPDYATKVDHNVFLWRDIIRTGDNYAENLPEYPYANNTFYINKEINFFLKRQDPYGYNELLCVNAFPNDINGNRYTEDTYYYKDEDEIVC